jgi:lipopolysaccharide transport system ATP-binding protein
MSQTIIAVEHLSKRYLIAHNVENEGHKHYIALRDVIGREVRNFARKTFDMARGKQVLQGDEIQEFWALKDVSFEVKKGEVLGIIGHNGAGKTTLLKILSRITEPTQGRVVLGGRVASLLEVGTGFHPELTGRENIYLSGAILGMTRREIRSKFDEIVAFAEVEKFLDTPVKRYSSGMYVRLAFAIAAHLEPEILIVDEVLAVGDAEFQKKCLGKMDEVSRREGRTVLFVSHNMGIVTSLCHRVIWLNHGSTERDGSARAVIDDYLERGAPSRNPLIEMGRNVRPPYAQGDERLRLLSLEWLSNLPLRHGELARARIHFKTSASVSGVSVGISFRTRESTRLLTYYTDFQDGCRPDLPTPGEYSVEVAIGALPLPPDVYEIEIGCRSGDFHVLDHVPACALAEIVAGPSTPGYILQRDSGVRLPSKWSWDFGGQSGNLQPVKEPGTALAGKSAIT